MTADYYVRVLDIAGDLQFVITDFAALAYTRKVNSPGLMQLTLRGDHPLLAAMQDKWQLEVWRKPAGGAFALDFVGLARQEEYYYGDRSTAVLTCPGLMSMLAWRVVAWYAGVANRSKFISAKAETISKTLVSYNATSSASVANGRIRAGTIAGLSIEADAAGGETVDWFCAWANLLETLQELARVGGGDFDLVKLTATTWQFRWYTGQLGTDRSASVIFAVQRGNMANPQYKALRISEVTAAIVGGQGEASSRVTAVRTGVNYAAGNDIEAFVNASDVSTTAGLQARGDVALVEMQAAGEFNFAVLQTPACEYGTHYGLGDLVAAANPFTGASETLKVGEAHIRLDGGGNEQIEIRMVTP